MNLSAVLTAAINDAGDLDDDELAVIVLKQIGCGARAVPILTPLVGDEIARLRRSKVRHNEKQAFSKSFVEAAGGMTEPVHVEIGPAFRRMFRDTFKVGGIAITWAEASAEQHLEKAGELRKHAAGAIATAQRHEAAATAIEERGVTCLADLEAEITNEVAA